MRQLEVHQPQPIVQSGVPRPGTCTGGGRVVGGSVRVKANQRIAFSTKRVRDRGRVRVRVRVRVPPLRTKGDSIQHLHHCAVLDQFRLVKDVPPPVGDVRHRCSDVAAGPAVEAAVVYNIRMRGLDCMRAVGKGEIVNTQ
jgi:hypothetical protein